MPTLSKTSLGQMLITSGKIDQAQLRDALELQNEKGGYIGQALVESNYLSSDELMPYLSRQLKVPYLKLGYYSIDEGVTEVLSEKTVRSNKIFPLFQISIHHELVTAF